MLFDATWNHVHVIFTRFSACRNVAEALVRKGLAAIIRHKRDDQDRSKFYDQLLVGEAAYEFSNCFHPHLAR